MVLWTVFEFDNATTYNYKDIATSEFQSISLLGALSTGGTIVAAVMKPPWARLLDVIGRAETYAVTVLMYIISYAMTASAKTFNTYSGGYIIYCLGQTGMQIFDQIIVADITTSRWRALANQLISLPFLYVPWTAAFIVESALETVGWRWGIGIFATILPISSLCVVVPIKYYQRRTRRLTTDSHPPPRELDLSLLSQVDLGGIILLSGGFALLLLPHLLRMGSRKTTHSSTSLPPQHQYRTGLHDRYARCLCLHRHTYLHVSVGYCRPSVRRTRSYIPHLHGWVHADRLKDRHGLNHATY